MRAFISFSSCDCFYVFTAFCCLGRLACVCVFFSCFLHTNVSLDSSVAGEVVIRNKYGV